MSDDGDDPTPAAGDGTPAAEPAAPAAAVAVDPRMRSRRIAVRRDEGRRRLKRATLVLALLALVVLAVAVLQSPVLDVDRVLVDRDRAHAAEAVRREAGVELGDALVGIDPGAVADRVEALPWVAEARVTRSWPSTVRIQVSEREATALVQVTADRAALIDDEGRVLSIERHTPDDAGGRRRGAARAHRHRGPGGRGRAAAGGGPRRPDDRRRRARAPAGLVVSVSTTLDATLVEGGEIRFGSVAELDDKITAAKTVLADVDDGLPGNAGCTSSWKSGLDPQPEVFVVCENSPEVEEKY